MYPYDVLPGQSVENYITHALHTDKYAWVEKNCYIDVYIELIHALGMEPLAMLPFTLAVDFCGDQWTFFKPQLQEMRDLYGVNVQEMCFWRTLSEHCIEHLPNQRAISVEADAFWLPDTFGTDYRKQHTKTTIIIVKFDPDRQRLTYFHNASLHQLQDEDFRQIFKIGVESSADYLVPYAELIHLNRLEPGSTEQLLEKSTQLLRRYLQLIPNSNPVLIYAERFSRDLPLMQEKGIAYYHLWAFNNTRQLGAAFELAAAYLQWLTDGGVNDFSPAIESFKKISSDNKALILKVARAVNSNRALDLQESFQNMAKDWEEGMSFLKKTLPL